MEYIIFTIVFVATLVALTGCIINLFFPKIRIWPPPEKRSWQFWFTWILAPIGMIGVPVIGILDMGTLGFNHWSRFLIGGSLILFAIPFAIWAIRMLSVHQTTGLKGTLLTKGPYKYTRNPQYVADILLYTGIILVTNSFMALITGILVILWFVLTPFSEEPWLQQQFGKQYEEYCKNVPRFIDLRSFQFVKVNH